MKKVRAGTIILISIMVLISGLFFKINWTPAKYAIREKEFINKK